MNCTAKLYFKYIDPEEAYLEVNLSSKVRKDLTKAFKSWKLTLQPFEHVLPLLDKAAVEVSSLMRDSFSRFRATDVFQKLEQARQQKSSQTV